MVVLRCPAWSFAPSTAYTILNAAGGLSGTFASVNELYPFLLSNLSYDANNAYLDPGDRRLRRRRGDADADAVGSVLDANVNNATGDFATVLGAMAVNTLPTRRPGDAAGRSAATTTPASRPRWSRARSSS